MPRQAAAEARRSRRPRGRKSRTAESGTMADHFPELAKDPTLDEEILADLGLSEAEFGARHRRGKQNRLDELRAMETRLAYESLRVEHARTEVLRASIEAALEDCNGDLRPIIAVPRTPAQAAAVFRLWFLKGSSYGARVEASLDDLARMFGELRFDEINVEIIRRVLLPVGEPESVKSVADAHHMNRQSIYLRLTKVKADLAELSEKSAFVPLLDEVRRLGEWRSPVLQLPMHHPLIAIAAMRASGEIGHVSDIVRFGIYCISREHAPIKSGSRRQRSWILA